MSPRQWTAGALACALATAMAGLAGCKVGPDYQAPQTEMSPAFDTGAGTAAAGPATQPAEIQRWWAALADAELDSLINRAMRANLDLDIAMARVQEARSFRYVIAADLFPTLGASGAYARTTGNNATRGRIAPALNSASDTHNVKEITYAAGFDMSWEIDLFGQVARAVEAAEADTQAAVEARNQVLVTIVADVVRSYAHLRGTQRRLEVARQNVLARQGILDVLQRGVALGLTNNLDLTLAQRQLESAKAAVAPLEAEIGVSQRQLAVLLGGDPQALYAELARTADIPKPPTAVATGEPGDLLRHRPDVRQAERQLAAETARIGVAVANFFPQINLTGALGFQGEGLHGSPLDQRFIYSLGPGVRWPILDFGRLAAAKELQDWRTQRALLSYRRTVEEAVQEVDDSLGRFATEQDRFQHLQAAVAASERAVKLAMDRYDRGLADFLNVLDAQRELYGLQDQAASSQETVVVNWAALNKALGRGWENIGPAEEPKFRLPGVIPLLDLIPPEAGAAPAASQPAPSPVTDRMPGS